MPHFVVVRRENGRRTIGRTKKTPAARWRLAFSTAYCGTATVFLATLLFLLNCSTATATTTTATTTIATTLFANDDSARYLLSGQSTPNCDPTCSGSRAAHPNSPCRTSTHRKRIALLRIHARFSGLNLLRVGRVIRRRVVARLFQLNQLAAHFGAGHRTVIVLRKSECRSGQSRSDDECGNECLDDEPSVILFWNRN